MSEDIQLRRDTAANWTSVNPILHQGEVGAETDTGKAKIGDGTTAWVTLGYWNPSGLTGGGGGAVASVFGRTGAVTASSGDYSAAQVTGAAPLASPALTGTPTAPTKTALTNSTAVATTAYTDAAVALALPLTGGSLSGPLSVAGALTTPPVTLTDATSITLAASASNVFRVTLGGNRTLANPTSPTDDQAIVVEVIQDGTGSRTLAYGSAYFFPASIGTPVLSSAPGAHDFLVFRYNAAATTWYCTGFVPQQGTAATATVSQGGTGLSSLTAYSLLAAGTTSTGAIQQIGVGTSGQVLTSNGAGALPTMQPASSGFSNPMTTAGDLIIENATPAPARLAIGTTGQVIGVSSGLPAWVSPPTTMPVPADFSQIAWTNDPGTAGSSSVLVSGTIYLSSFVLRSTQTIGHIGVHIISAGVTLTAGQSLLGIYSISGNTGTLQAQTADQSAVWTSTGAYNTALTSSYTNAPAGRYLAAFLSVGTTPPTFRSGGTSGLLGNIGLSGAAFRFAINGTSQTTLPGTLTLTSNTNSGSIPLTAVMLA